MEAKRAESHILPGSLYLYEQVAVYRICTYMISACNGAKPTTTSDNRVDGGELGTSILSTLTLVAYSC